MKKLLTLLLVLCFAFSGSAVTTVPEIKAEKCKVEKSAVNFETVDLVSESTVFTGFSTENTVLNTEFRFTKEAVYSEIKMETITNLQHRNPSLYIPWQDKKTD